jgi:hypothetical protein
MNGKFMFKTICKLFVGMVALFCVGISPAEASKEGMLLSNSFSIDSDGIDLSGPVKINGTQTDTGITALRVRAFNRDISLSNNELAKLRGFVFNGMQLSYAKGLLNDESKTVFIIFTKGFTSGVADSRTIELNAQGRMVIRDK